MAALGGRAIVTGAAVIAPSGDPFSMLALAVPLYVFDEISIVIGEVLRPRGDSLLTT